LGAWLSQVSVGGILGPAVAFQADVLVVVVDVVPPGLLNADRDGCPAVLNAIQNGIQRGAHSSLHLGAQVLLLRLRLRLVLVINANLLKR